MNNSKREREFPPNKYSHLQLANTRDVDTKRSMSTDSTQCALVILEVWCEWLVAMWTGRIKRLCCDLKDYFFI